MSPGLGWVWTTGPWGPVAPPHWGHAPWSAVPGAAPPSSTAAPVAVPRDRDATALVAVPRDRDAGDEFPSGEFITASWPLTKAGYPPAEEENSWKAMERIAHELGTIIKLGGRKTGRRKARAVARLTVKGVNAEDAFYAVLEASRRLDGFNVKKVRSQG